MQVRTASPMRRKPSDPVSAYFSEDPEIADAYFAHDCSEVALSGAGTGGRESGALRFTPYAWAKLQYFCHAGDTEIGGFGLSDPDDPLRVIDLLTVKQSVSSVSVEFDDDAVAELFEDQVDAGRRPEQFARLWCHTHPGHSPAPSPLDEETFERVFGNCDWAVMFILAKGGQTYARLRFRAGPGGEIEIPVAVDYASPFPGSDASAWELEFETHIHPEPPATRCSRSNASSTSMVDDQLSDTDDLEWNPSLLSGSLDDWELADPEEAPDSLLYDAMDVQLLMDEYGVSDPAELRALLQYESPLPGEGL